MDECSLSELSDGASLSSCPASSRSLLQHSMVWMCAEFRPCVWLQVVAPGCVSPRLVPMCDFGTAVQGLVLLLQVTTIVVAVLQYWLCTERAIASFHRFGDPPQTDVSPLLLPSLSLNSGAAPFSLLNCLSAVISLIGSFRFLCRGTFMRRHKVQIHPISGAS